MKNLKTYLIVSVIGFGLGYLIGRIFIENPKPETIVKVEWRESEKIIRDTIKIIKPYETKIVDTVPVPVYTDTAALYAVWKDYYTERKYDLDFSNDTLGLFKVKAIVFKNSLTFSSSEIKPKIRTVTETKTIYKIPAVQFYGMIGSSLDFKTLKVQGGLDIKQKYLIGVSGIKINEQVGYTLDFGVKF